MVETAKITKIDKVDNDRIFIRKVILENFLTFEKDEVLNDEHAGVARTIRGIIE